MGIRASEYSIRLAERKDAEGILGIYAPFIRHSAVSFEMEVPSVDAFWDRVETVLMEAPWLVCTLDDQIAGYAYAAKHRDRPAYRYTRELSVYVGEAYRRKGVAAGLYLSLIELLKLQGFCNTLIGITLPNPASVRFHERMGFKEVGVYHRVGFKYGAYHDVGWWEMVIREGLPGELFPVDRLEEKSFSEALRKGVAKIAGKEK